MSDTSGIYINKKILIYNRFQVNFASKIKYEMARKNTSQASTKDN